MIVQLESREKVQIHLIANKVNEIISYLNNQEIEMAKEKTQEGN